MILPGSYANGFAPRDGQPLYLELWRGCVGAWAPCLGPTGLTLRDSSLKKNHGAFENLTAFAAWSQSHGRHSLAFSGAANEAITWTSGALTASLRPFTLSWWYQGNTVSATRHWLYQNNTATSSPGIGVTIERVSDTSHRLGLFSGAYTYSSQFAWDLGLHHYAITWLADDTVIFYRDGVLVSSSTRAPGGTDGVTWQLNRLGTAPGIAGFHMTGKLIQLDKHTRNLSASEIKLLSQRPGIAYEIAPRRRASVAVAAFNRRRRLLVGAGS